MTATGVSKDLAAPLTVDLATGPERAWAALTRAAEQWGAELEREGKTARLRLPVIAGVRRGWSAGAVAIEPLPEGSRLSLRIDEEETYLHTPAVVLLALGAAGGLVTAAWPFFPQLLPVVPLGILLALATWFLVSSRLRHAGPQELLDMVAAVVGEQNGEPPPASAARPR